MLSGILHSQPSVELGSHGLAHARGTQKDEMLLEVELECVVVESKNRIEFLPGEDLLRDIVAVEHVLLLKERNPVHCIEEVFVRRICWHGYHHFLHIVSIVGWL